MQHSTRTFDIRAINSQYIVEKEEISKM